MGAHDRVEGFLQRFLIRARSVGVAAVAGDLGRGLGRAVDRAERPEQRLHPVGQRLPGQILVGEQCVAADRRQFPRRQHGAHRRLRRIGRIRMPDAAEIDPLMLQLENRRDFREAVDPVDHGIGHRLCRSGGRRRAAAPALSPDRGRRSPDGRAAPGGSPPRWRPDRSAARSTPRISAPIDGAMGVILSPVAVALPSMSGLKRRRERLASRTSSGFQRRADYPLRPSRQNCAGFPLVFRNRTSALCGTSARSNRRFSRLAPRASVSRTRPPRVPHAPYREAVAG